MHARTALGRQEKRLRVAEVVDLGVARPVRGVGGGDAHVAGLVDVLLQLLSPAARHATQIDARVLVWCVVLVLRVMCAELAWRM